MLADRIAVEVWFRSDRQDHKNIRADEQEPEAVGAASVSYHDPTLTLDSILQDLMPKALTWYIASRQSTGILESC